RGWNYALYTTWRSTPEQPRWRVVLPLAEPVPPERLKELIVWGVDQSGLTARDRCDNPSHLFYLPVVPSDNAPDAKAPAGRRAAYRLVTGEGEFLVRPGNAGREGGSYAVAPRNPVCHPAGASPARPKPSPAGR